MNDLTIPIKQAVDLLTNDIDLSKRNLSMPGDPNYQPSDLMPYLGYDQWAGWLIIVEWFWMIALATVGVIPARDAKYLTDEGLFRLLQKITNTDVRDLERIKMGHDILALLELMRKYLPKALHKWLHFCGTSYDIICTAYALMYRMTFLNVFWPKLCEVDDFWRKRIYEYSDILMAGRTHLMTALPNLAGFWLAYLHSRYTSCARNTKKLCQLIPGKFTGAIGTSASQLALIGHTETERVMMQLLSLPQADITTQITPPEATARFFFELVLLSGVLGNFGDDVRILQSSQYGEILTASSSSSAMPHKKSNPVAAENDAGMHVSVVAENMKVILTLICNLQRDLRWSNVMRSYSAVMVFSYQQLNTTLRILKTMKVNSERCQENFGREANLVVAELLHLFLQVSGYPESHRLVNEDIVPIATEFGAHLAWAMDKYCASASATKQLRNIWDNVPAEITACLANPDRYLGRAKELAVIESKNSLREAG